MKTPYRYGLINGLIVGVFSLCFFSLVNWLNNKFGWGVQPSNIRGVSGLLTIVIQCTGIYLGMRQVKFEQGTITYGEAFKTGFIMALITAVIAAIFSFVYCTLINPGYAAYMIAEAHKTMLANGEPASEMAAHLQSAKKEFSTSSQVTMALVGQSVIGTAISLIIAPFIKTKKV